MNISSWKPGRLIASVLVLMLAMPIAEAAPVLPQQEQALPDQPKPQQPNVNVQVAQNAPAAQTQTPALETRDQSAQSSTDQPQNGNAKPVGTAAAPAERSSGVTASRPAGAVIAPAKQRHARSILIRVGIVLGAAAAVGAVIGLSKATPSRPK